jgi:Cu(I)/Ag(I) efflux system protein CusF
MFRTSFLMKLVMIAGLGVFAAFAWLSLPTPPRPQGEQPGHNHASDPVVLADGVVLSIDRTASRITISHGPLYNLGMPPMTMEFQVGNPALLEQVKAGDKVKFHADVGSGGSFSVTTIERAAQ